tara:strand:- start:839 stop:1015 length:177 start_codon:yes stop_codon:yes gene_type:complete
MLSNKEKKNIADDLKEFGLIDDKIEKAILKKEIEIRKNKSEIKKIIDSNKGLDSFLTI